VRASDALRRARPRQFDLRRIATHDFPLKAAAIVIAVLFAIVTAVRVGGWIARNTGPLGRLDRCITKSHGRAEVSQCFARFANEVRP